MAWFIVCISLVLLQTTVAEKFEIVATSEPDGSCLTRERRDEIIQNTTASIQAILQEKYHNSCNGADHACGPGQWHCVAYLNMSDRSQQCPTAWREYSTNGIRACGRPVSLVGSCPAVFYSTGQQYNRVCGRAVGYQVGGPFAFTFEAWGRSIDSFYVYGVSITYGTPRNHIWTLAGGVTDLTRNDSGLLGYNCPCSDPPSSRFNPPSFVGDNYYCESGNSDASYVYHRLYSSDPLWDGQQCEVDCCSNGKSPPWFNVELSNSTTDDIEVRICGAEGTKDDTPIELLELYIQ